MVDTLVLKRVTWQHKVVYMSAGQPMVYEEMSAVLFVNGYLTLMVGESEDMKPHIVRHLMELMEDAEAYGWESVRSHHAAWLQQIEQGRACWQDKDKKMKLCRALV